MNDHEFDLNLKQRAEMEGDPVPAGFRDRLQAAVDQLPEREEKRARHKLLRPALIAAVLAAVLLGTALAAASGFDFVEIYSSGEKTLPCGNGGEFDILYLVTPNGMTCFSVEDLPQTVRDAAVRSDRQLAYLRFDDWNAARDFVGLGLLSNTALEESGEPIRFGTWRSGIMDDRCVVELCGSGPGIICVTAAYVLDEDMVMLEATAMTDEVDPDIVPMHGLLAYDGVDSAEAEEYATASGVEAIIMTNNWSGELHTVMGYFTQNGIHYNLEVNSTEKEHCVQTMKEVLDGFQ